MSHAVIASTSSSNNGPHLSPEDAAKQGPIFIGFSQKIPYLVWCPSTVRHLGVVTRELGKYTRENPHYFGYQYDGKVNPSKYGSTLTHDLGLCYETFCTRKACRFGNQCIWRHDELLPKEEIWMANLGARCITGMKVCQAFPERPKVTEWDVYIAE